MSCSCDKYPNCLCGESFRDTRLPNEVKQVNPTSNALSISDYDIPGNKADDILDYYKKLRSKHPHITQARLTKKVAEYFHLQKKEVVV